MDKEQLYNIIEEFLEGTLSGDELQAFEQRLQTEPDLAEEVELHRKIHGEIGDAQKRMLKSKLDTLREEFTQKEENETKVVPINRGINLKMFISVAAGILVLVFAIWFFFFKTPEKREIVNEDTPIEKEQIDPNETPIKEIEDPSNLVENQNDPEKESNQKDNIEDITPEESLIANFDPNPELENLIAQNGNNDDIEFAAEKPDENDPFILKNSKIDLQINGMLFASEIKNEENFAVSIYDNNPQNYTSKKSINTFQLSIEKDDGEEEDGLAFASKNGYFYSLQKTISVKPGLYYYLIIQKGQTTPLYSGKFEVKE